MQKRNKYFFLVILSLLILSTTIFLIYINRPQRRAIRHLRKAIIYEGLKDYDRAINEYNLVLPNAVEPEKIHLAIGRLYAINGDYPNALAEFDKAIEIKPNLLEAYLGKVDILIRKKDYNSSRSTIEIIKTGFPESIEAYLLSAHLFIIENNLKDAKKELFHVLYTDPTNANARLLLSQIYLNEKDLQKAKRNALACIKYSKGALSQAYLILTDIFISKEDYSKAIKYLGQWVITFPNDIERQLMLGELYLRNNDPTNAIQRGLDILKISPKNILASYLLGRAYFLNLDYKSAKDYLRYAIKNMPPDAKLYAQLGTVYEKLGVWKKAIHYYKKAIALDPDILPLRWSLATVALEKGLPNISIQQCRKILQKEPQNIYALNMLAICYINTKEYKKAEEIVNEITNVAPEFVYKDIYLAMTKWSVGQVVECINILKNAIEKDPANITCRNLLAMVYLHTNQLNLSLEQFQEIKKYDYKNIPAFLNIAKIYISTGNLKLAHKEYITILSYYPDLVPARIGLGNLYLYIRNYRGALEQFEIAEKKQPNQIQIILGKMQALLGIRRYKEVIDIGESALKSNCHNPLLNGLLGVAYRNVGDIETSERYLAKVLELNPNITIGYELGSILVYRNQYNEAIELYKKMLNINPRFAPILRKMAILCHLVGDYNNALRYIESIVPQDSLIDLYIKFFIYLSIPNYAHADQVIVRVDMEPYGFKEHFLRFLKMARKEPFKTVQLCKTFNKALFYQLSNWQEECINTLEDIIKKEPALTIAHHIIARTYTDIGERDKAIDCYKKILEISPEDPLANFQLSTLLFRIDKKESIKFLQRTIDLLPQITDLKVTLAMLYYRIGDEKMAIEVYNDLINKGTKNPIVYNNLAWIYITMKRYHEALELINRAIELAPEDPTILDTLGWLYLKMGENDKAIDILSNANKLLPEDLTILYHLAMAYYYDGLLTESQIRMEKILEINPGYSKARHMLEKIADRMHREIIGE